jgi:sterol desaturase/sphingolipid hydroxylase (fatty acid hydroxylase superfamily)
MPELTFQFFFHLNYGGILIIWDRLFGTYQAESASHKASYAFGRTGWQPSKCAKQAVDE